MAAYLGVHYRSQQEGELNIIKQKQTLIYKQAVMQCLAAALQRNIAGLMDKTN